MKKITINRSTDLIAAEIINIKEQTKKMVIYNSIEIGRRLVEAKEIIGHGEWGKWLEKSVDYSQRTATNLMRIFEEYGSDQITLLSNNSKSQALASLSYTQAVALLGIPSEEREEFIQINDIEAMSTRELNLAIKAKEKAEKEKEEFKNLANEKSVEVKMLFDEKIKAQADKLLTDKSLQEAQNQLSEALVLGNNEEVQRLQKSLLEVQKNLDSSAEKIYELEAQLKEKQIDVIAAEPAIIIKIPEEIEKELEELRKKASQNGDQSIIRFEIYCEALQKTFSLQLELMDEIKKTNPETYDKCRNAILDLVNKISEGL